MTEDDPRRLKDGGDAPPELVRALKALGRDRDAARLARVAQKLGAALAEPPPPTAAGESGGIGTLFGLKGLITAVVLGVAVVSLWVWRQTPTAPAEPPRAAETSAREPARPPAPDTQVPPRPIAVPPSAGTRAVQSAAARSSSAPADSQRRGVRTRAGTTTPSSAVQPAGSSRSTSATTAADAPNDAEGRTTAEPAAREPEAQPDEPRQERLAAQPREAPRPRSEVELLFEARKAMASQPLAALSLIDEHTARYPRGQLAPEREVLRIEALRKLGRTAEADRSRRAFQSRYPKSIHLRRLEGGAGSTLP